MSNNCENTIRISKIGVTVYAYINNKYLKEKIEKHKQHRWKKKGHDEQCTRVEQTKALYNITICAFALFIYRDIQWIKRY